MLPAPGASCRRRLPPDAGVHICPICGSDLVYPVDWTRLEGSLWHLNLRCPNCQLERDVVLVREAVEQFNRLLYHGAQELAHEAEELSRQHFEEEAEKLVAALRGDQILPMDFSTAGAPEHDQTLINARRWRLAAWRRATTP